MNDSPLSPHDSEAFVAELVAVTRSELPLAAGLRTAAAESENRRVGKSLQRLATQIEAGESLDKVLATSNAQLPAAVPRLLLAGERNGRLGEALQDIVEHDSMTRESLRLVRSTLAYPLALLAFSYICFVFLQFVVTGDMLQQYADFELDLPAATQWMVRVYQLRWWLVIAPIVVISIVCIVLPLVLSRARRHRVLATVPLFGAMWHWCGVAQGTRSLAHLLAQRVPLPEALRVASQGLRDANVSEVWSQLAQEVEHGMPLSRAILDTYRLPASIAPLVYWGERTASLPESLLAASDMLEGRVRLRAQLIRTIAPPLLFVLIGSSIYFMVFALVVPLMALIQNLSG